MKPYPLSKKEFERLSPYARGYAVYTAGWRPDQPNIPDETNPYPEDSEDYKDWNDGYSLAKSELQECA